MTILIYGLVNSVILILAALGFSLTFGLSRVANFAHGGLYLFAGLTTWLLYKRLGLAYRFMHYSDGGLYGDFTIGADFHMVEIAYRF